ncbi:MAG: serine hydrolase domain-containing protein [Armatimonadota bacterium]
MPKDPMRAARQLLLRGIEAGATPGATVHVSRYGETIWREALGTTDGTTPTTLDTRYDLASLTKPIATAATVVAIAARGDLLLSSPIADVLGSDGAAFPGITVRHLLTHTSGLPAWIACHAAGPGLPAAVAAIAGAPCAAPGSRYEYSCLGYILLAAIVEHVAGAPLDQVARRHVFKPFGGRSLGFRPGPVPGVAPTVSREGTEAELPVVLRGVVHDGNARAIESAGASVSGNAGLFGAVDDVAAFGSAVCGWGKRRRQLWSDPVRHAFLDPCSEPAGHTLGLFCAPNPLVPSGDLFSPRAVGHSGYTGTALLIDPEHDVVVAVLANAVFGEGKADWLVLRRRLMTAIAAALP